MKSGLLIGIITFMIIMSVLAAICEMAAPVSADRAETLEKLMHPEWNDFNIPVIGTIIATVSVVWGYMSAFFALLFWSSPFFSGSWSLLWIIMVVPTSLAIILTLILAAIRGTSSS